MPLSEEGKAEIRDLTRRAGAACRPEKKARNCAVAERRKRINGKKRRERITDYKNDYNRRLPTEKGFSEEKVEKKALRKGRGEFVQSGKGSLRRPRWRMKEEEGIMGPQKRKKNHYDSPLLGECFGLRVKKGKVLSEKKVEKKRIGSKGPQTPMWKEQSLREPKGDNAKSLKEAKESSSWGQY